MRPKLAIDPSKINPDKARASQPAPKGGAKGAAVGMAGAGKGFKVPEFPREFTLSEATGVAYKRAVNYMNNMLGDQGMQLDLTPGEEAFDATGDVVDKATGRTVNSYEGVKILKLYAQNIRERGIIVDGGV